jgi:acetylornithine aminotransferase
MALDRRLLINVTAGSVIRLLPPLVMTTEQADDLVAGLSALVQQFLSAN